MFSNIFTPIKEVVSNILLTLALLTGVAATPIEPVASPVQAPELGATISAIADFRTSLASSISANATEMTLVSFDTGSDSLVLGERYGFKIGGSEYVIGTASSSNRIVDMVRGLSRRTATSSVSAYQQGWGRGTAVEITDAPLILDHANKLNGAAGFESVLRYATSTATTSFTTSKDIVSKEYVDGVAFNGAGVVDATTAARGVSEFASQAEAGSSTSNGTAGPLVLPASLATTTYNAGTSAFRIPMTDSNGLIDEEFIPHIITASSTYTATTTFANYVEGISSSTVKIYTASTTYVKPAGLRHVVVEVQGAGGGGAGPGAGGGAGAYAKKLIRATELASSTAIVISAAGVGSGNTSFGTTTAGNGANAVNTTGGSGGTATLGDININGQAGQSTTASYAGGDGGDSFLGNGGPGGLFPQNGTDANAAGSASGYGAGGGGGGSANDGSPTAGATAGTQGVVIVTEYF